MDEIKRYHSVRLDKTRCKGCTNCLKHCPTDAIRVRGGRAHIIDERCIDCGECIRICDYHAKVAVTDDINVIHGYKYAIALPAPSLYGQFKNLRSIGPVLEALKKIGFDDVFEVARGADIVSRAIREKLREPGIKGETHMNNKIAIVTGGNSGIGRCAAIYLKKAGCTVYDFSRREITCEGIHHIKTDVTDESSVTASVKEVIEKEGKIDIVVNSAGFGISGAVEFTEISDAKAQFDVNFFGTVNVNKSVIPYMRKNKGGRIVNISSVAAVAHIPFQTYYSASKAAIESYTCALANEVKPFGITVTAIAPGDICTEFTQARQKSFDGDDVYLGRIARSVQGMEKDEQKGMKPEAAGKYIAEIALKKNVKPIYAIGITYKILSVLCKTFPCGFRNKVVGNLYAK